jgi:hypothetical protein
MMPAIPLCPLRPLMVTHLPRLPRFVARPQLPTRPLTPPRREGHLLRNLSALQPVVSTTSVSALVWRWLSVVNSGIDSGVSSGSPSMRLHNRGGADMRRVHIGVVLALAIGVVAAGYGQALGGGYCTMAPITLADGGRAYGPSSELP